MCDSRMTEAHSRRSAGAVWPAVLLLRRFDLHVVTRFDQVGEWFAEVFEAERPWLRAHLFLPVGGFDQIYRRSRRASVFPFQSAHNVPIEGYGTEGRRALVTEREIIRALLTPIAPPVRNETHLLRPFRGDDVLLRLQRARPGLFPQPVTDVQYLGESWNLLWR